jgi:hypothetical protein
MKYLLFAVLLSLPSYAYSQAMAFEQPGPVATITASGSYIYGEPQGGSNKSLWGWNLSPEISVTRQFSMQGDFGNYYMESVSQGQNRLILAAGPRYNFVARWHRVTPFVFAEGGEMRLTFQDSSYRDWDPVAIVGAGLKYRLSRRLAITIVPGEYMAHNLDAGPWDKNFSTRAGFTYNFFR